MDDVGSAPDTDLASWAAAGVLPLNVYLTTEEGERLAHKAAGWDVFTRSVLSLIAEQTSAVLLCLGIPAKEAAFEAGFPPGRMVIRSHPSDQSFYRNLVDFGARPSGAD